jgi:hypothetical protein
MNETIDFSHKVVKMNSSAECEYVNLDVLKWWDSFRFLHRVMYLVSSDVSE